MELKHGEPELWLWRISIHSSTPALEESFRSNGQRPSTTENSGNRLSNNQQKMRSSTDAGDHGADTPSKSQWPVPHVNPWPGSHRESKVRPQKTPQNPPLGATIWRLKQWGWVTSEDSLRGWPKIGMPGELLYVAHTALEDKGYDEGVPQVQPNRILVKKNGETKDVVTRD